MGYNKIGAGLADFGEKIGSALAKRKQSTYESDQAFAKDVTDDIDTLAQKGIVVKPEDIQGMTPSKLKTFVREKMVEAYKEEKPYSALGKYFEQGGTTENLDLDSFKTEKDPYKRMAMIGDAYQKSQLALAKGKEEIKYKYKRKDAIASTEEDLKKNLLKEGMILTSADKMKLVSAKMARQSSFPLAKAS